MSDLLKPSGETSSIRVSMFICVLTGCSVAVIGVLNNQDLVGLGVLVGTLIGVGIGGKVAQKSKEG